MWCGGCFSREFLCIRLLVVFLLFVFVVVFSGIVVYIVLHQGGKSVFVVVFVLVVIFVRGFVVGSGELLFSRFDFVDFLAQCLLLSFLHSGFGTKSNNVVRCEGCINPGNQSHTYLFFKSCFTFDKAFATLTILIVSLWGELSIPTWSGSVWGCSIHLR
jgi:hypothetical protein